MPKALGVAHPIAPAPKWQHKWNELVKGNPLTAAKTMALAPAVSPLSARIWAGVLRVLTSAPAMTAALVFWPPNSKDDPGYKGEWAFNKLSSPLTNKDRTRLAYLEQEQAHRALTIDEQAELFVLLARVKGVHGQLSKLDARLTVEEAQQTAALDRDGGHSYTDHGAQTTEMQQVNRLRTGKAPSGRVLLNKKTGKPVIPKEASKFFSNAKHLEAAQKAEMELAKRSSNGTLSESGSEKIIVDVRDAGPSYSLDVNNNVVSNLAQRATAIYKLNSTSGKYQLVTLYPSK